ncbi:hypothetical protein GP486_006176 [Trichoglossum hirsutum]|uniref:Mus7/MMS22 family-domain-containing protein n=1 Tax=Trichoglossum hirsutum TaxID=265104 RepID=A0A9P8IE19_9PEZI|nr:hypothetical protein GP486_006176 [Trichoglossum hirsutum]
MDLMDLKENESSENSLTIGMQFESPMTSLVVTGQGIGTAPVEPQKVCTAEEHLDQKSRPTTPTSSSNIHRSMGSTLKGVSMDADPPSPLSSTISSPPTTLSTPSFTPQGSQSWMVKDSPSVQVVTSKPGSRHRPVNAELTIHGEIDLEPPRRLNHSLRKRNPIQLHPYLLEDQRYKQSLKARGVKPIRVVEVENQVARVSKAKYSQDQEFQAEDDSRPNGIHCDFEDVGSSQLQQIDSLRVSAEDGSQSPTEEESGFRAAGDDEEFPDVDTLLERQLSGAVQRGHKRRKTEQSGLQGVPSRPLTNASLVEVDVLPVGKPPSNPRSFRIIHRAEHQEEQDIFNFPVSPSRSPGQRPSEPSSPISPASPTAPGFRFPRGFPSYSRQEAHVSVALKRRVTVESSEESDSEPRSLSRRAKHSLNSSRSASPSPTSSSEEETAVQLRSVQRKIRGVLPASWLKLDQQNQIRSTKHQTKGDRRNHHLLAAKAIDRPGLARIKSMSRTLSTSTSPDGIIETFDDSEDTGNRGHLHKGSDTQLAQISSQASEVLSWAWPDIGEVEEDNRVDMMSPSPQNPARRRSKPKKKRQRRLDDFVSASDPRQPLSVRSGKSASNHARQSATTDHLPRKRPTARARHLHREPGVPKLSILDAPKAVLEVKGSTPPFLRIAHRQARSRRDKARHSPSGKVIKLHTWEDTQDAQTVLRAWREGTIQPAASGGFSSIVQDPDQSGKGLEEQQTGPPILGLPGDNLEKDKENVASRLNPLKPVVRQMQINPIAYGPPILRILTTGRDRKPLQPRDLAQVNADPRLAWVPPSKSKGNPRPAQLEVLETKVPNRNRRAAFASDLSLLDRLYRKQVVVSPREHNLQLARYLAHDNRSVGIITAFGETKAQSSSHSREQVPTPDIAFSAKVIRKPRKRPPKRLDPGFIENIPLDEPILTQSRRADLSPTKGNKGEVTLQGLRPYGTCYTSNFGITPLRIGTYFHESTFVGSGDLSKVLQTAQKRDYHLNVGYATFNSAERPLRWGSWDDTVSSQLGSGFDWLALSIERLCDQDMIESEASRVPGSMLELKRFLMFVITYFKDFLSFADPIDRNSFIRRSTQVFQALLERLIVISHPQAHQCSDHSAKFIAQASTSLLVLAYQVLQISKKGSLETSPDVEAEELLKSMARWLIRLLFYQDLKQIRSFYEDNQCPSKRDEGIRGDGYIIEGWVVMIHILHQSNGQNELFWGLLNQQLEQDKIPRVADVQFFEKSWYSIISVLPLFEFDEFGVFKVGRRFQYLDDNWKFIKALTSQLLSIYTSNPSKQLASFNGYCRTVFSRCHHLIKGWGWKKCESIIGTLFDFFASNNLAHLKREEVRGSPRFLEQLDQEQSLEVEPEDRCFHMLLKIIGVGLKAMSQIYPERKIRNIIFRLMPNHGRQYPKEEAVRQEDLESLRNHHNLLCTLYWASPPSSRPPINAIRDLVNPETSHRRACHISLRAWSNLIRFQLSTEEPASSLEPFMKWHNDLTSQMLKQHGLARTEAQAHFAASVNASGITAITPELLEKTISDNQQQVEAVLSDALISMKNAMAISKRTDLAMALLSRNTTADVFQLFDAKKNRLNKVISQSITIIQEYVKTFNSRNDHQSTPQTNEDSQDYGDWSALEDIVSQEFSCKAAEHLRNIVYDSLLRLVSNCFGADVVPDDDFLLMITDAWVSVAQCLVKEGLKQWNNFIGSYSPESWSSFRNTEQTRKFTAYFLSRVIESDATSYKANKSFFLSFWMSSLVERESLLKHQNRFTNVLLNHDPVLANMRESVEESALVSERESAALRQAYAQHLKSLMGSMKSNYEESRQGSTCSGAYVEFVQTVVEFLQQHTIDICPVDKFFTDSSAFPLPATDPTYVVGRLKNYGLKLSESRIHIQLATFLQSVSERAAAEQQQSYLTGQLCTAMSDTFESGDVKKPTLRAFLTQAIFPAYIEVALDTPAGWILARSVLRSLGSMFDTLLTDVDSGNPACVSSVIAILAHVLDSFRLSAGLLIAHSGLLEQPTVLNTLTSYFSTITSMLHPLDYLWRRSHRGGHAVKCVAFFTAFATFILQVLTDHQDEAVSPYVICPDFSPLPTPFPEVRNFCTQELRNTLKRNWSRRGDEYHVVRGKTTVEVVVETGSLEEEKTRLLEGLADYLGVVGRMKALRCGEAADGGRRVNVGALFL